MADGMILVIYGTRPEATKLAPIVAEARARGLPVHVHCTMQSPDLVDREMLAWDTIDANGLSDAMDAAKLVVVQGDTRTAFQHALNAFDERIPVFHVEAGVRTYDLSSPHPEEGYRQMISRIARYHACSTAWNYEHLDAEGVVARGWAAITGSPIVESVRQRVAELQTVPVAQSRQILLTLHRRENRPHFEQILRGVAAYAYITDATILWPTHPNGWALDACPAEIRERFTIVPPMPPHAFTQAMLDSAFVVTDSGGVQEECNVLGIPCVVARSVTDRPESVGQGGATLPDRLDGAGIYLACSHEARRDRATIRRDIFGDGSASERIVDWWQEILG